MQRNEFSAQLSKATSMAADFARKYVSNDLPDTYLYELYPNQSYDGNRLRGDEEIFPEESLPSLRDDFLGPLSSEQVVAFLWRDGKIPEWIDISVSSTDGDITYMGLRCCGRYSAMREYHYYRGGEMSPFGIKSPNFPRGWIEGGEKFDVSIHSLNKDSS